MIKLNLKNPLVKEEPFRHIIFQNCIPLDQKAVTAEAMAVLDAAKKTKAESSNYSKIEVKHADGICGQLLDAMCGEELGKLCSKYFTLPGLTPDPEYDGGGLTMTAPGKFLRYHYDFPFSSVAKKYRVVNALLYLSDPAIEGGELHLLDADSGTVEATVSPKFGTLAIFATSDKSPHGVSKIRRHPRISINSYFYLNQPLDNRVEPSKTTWLNELKGMDH